MDFGVASKIISSYPSDLYQNNKATGTAASTSFLSAVFTQVAEKTGSMSFEEMWKSRYPGGYYHVMDGSKISHQICDRNDFPLEKFFSDNVDESILDWQPSGPEPSDSDWDVMSKRSSVAGQMSLIVHPALEEKMKNDPELAKRVMATVGSFITDYQAHRAEPGCSYLIELTEDGEIGKYYVCGPLHISQSTSGGGLWDEIDRRHEEYEQIAKENAIKRKLQEKMIERKRYQNDILMEDVSAAETSGNIL